MQHLSPLSFHSILARLRDTTPALVDGKNKPEMVIMYRCPVCDELHDDEFDAEECCTPVVQDDGIQPTKCPVCGEKYETHRHAADCCLWKDYDAPTRWKIADAVEAGSSWSVELWLKAH